MLVFCLHQRNHSAFLLFMYIRCNLNFVQSFYSLKSLSWAASWHTYYTPSLWTAHWGQKVHTSGILAECLLVRMRHRQRVKKRFGKEELRFLRCCRRKGRYHWMKGASDTLKISFIYIVSLLATYRNSNPQVHSSSLSAFNSISVQKNDHPKTRGSR